MDQDHSNVPVFVVKCIELLEPENVITTPGLYRASGNKTVMDEVRKKINQGSSKNKRFECLRNQDVNTLTGLLKQFFRELEEPLISEQTVQNCLDCIGTQTCIEDLKHYLLGLPEPEKSTLRYLMQHLRRVSQFRADNKMDSLNLSIVWGPCVFKAINTAEAIQNGSIEKINRVLKELIDHFETIFDEERAEECRI